MAGDDEPTQRAERPLKSAPPGARLAEGRGSLHSKIETRNCDSCEERNALSPLGLPRWGTYGLRSWGCSQCGGSGRVPRDSLPYAVLPPGARPVWDRPRPQRRFRKTAVQSADLRLAQTKKQERFLEGVYAGLDVKEAADDAGISERMGWKVLHQIKEMSHLIQERNREVEGAKTLPLLLPYLTDRERQWLLDIATFKAAGPLAEHWGVKHDAARQRGAKALICHTLFRSSTVSVEEHTFSLSLLIGRLERPDGAARFLRAPCCSSPSTNQALT
jgi:hypothetical protein